MGKPITDAEQARYFMLLHPTLRSGGYSPLFWYEGVEGGWRMGISKSNCIKEPVGDFDVTVVTPTMEEGFVPLANLVIEVYGDYRNRIEIPGLN